MENAALGQIPLSAAEFHDICAVHTKVKTIFPSLNLSHGQFPQGTPHQSNFDCWIDIVMWS